MGLHVVVGVVPHRSDQLGEGAGVTTRKVSLNTFADILEHKFVELARVLVLNLGNVCKKERIMISYF